MGNELIVKEELNIALLFVEKDELKKKLKEIESEVLSIVPDIATAKGRKEIASLAYKVAQSKVALDSLGKDLVSDWKIKAAKVDESRKFAREFLDDLKDRVRQPLTDWEAAEEARIRAEAEAVKYASDWDEAHRDHELFLRVKELERKEAELAAIKAAQLAKEQAALEAEEARQAEIARQKQAEIDEANRIAREKRIAEEAAEKAKKEAEQKLIDAENKRIRDLALAQEKAEAEKKALEEAQEKARIDAERRRLADIQAEKDKAEKARKDMIAAQEEEARKQAEAAAKEKAEEEKRQKNAAHQKRIKNEAWVSLQYIEGITPELAKKIVLAIDAGKVTNVFIKY